MYKLLISFLTIIIAGQVSSTDDLIGKEISKEFRYNQMESEELNDSILIKYEGFFNTKKEVFTESLSYLKTKHDTLVTFQCDSNSVVTIGKKLTNNNFDYIHNIRNKLGLLILKQKEKNGFSFLESFGVINDTIIGEMPYLNRVPFKTKLLKVDKSDSIVRVKSKYSLSNGSLADYDIINKYDAKSGLLVSSTSLSGELLLKLDEVDTSFVNKDNLRIEINYINPKDNSKIKITKQYEDNSSSKLIQEDYSWDNENNPFNYGYPTKKYFYKGNKKVTVVYGFQGQITNIQIEYLELKKPKTYNLKIINEECGELIKQLRKEALPYYH